MRPALVLAVMLTGCAASAEKMYLPDGSSGYAVNCRGMGSACLQKASDLCGPSGYDLLNAKSRADQNVLVGAYGGGTSTAEFSQMLIRCK